jgi:hypothetical protein
VPLKEYECLREAGGCGSKFRETRPVEFTYEVTCPMCGADGRQTFTSSEYGGKTLHRIEWLPPQSIYHTPDLDHAEGRTGDSVPMPAYGPNVRVSSRRQLKNLREKAREAIHAAHGIDPGPIGHVDRNDADAIVEAAGRSPFKPQLTIDQHLKELEQSVGPPPSPGEELAMLQEDMAKGEVTEE